MSAAQVAAAVRMAGGGATVGLLHDPQAREDVPIVLRLPRTAAGLDALRAPPGAEPRRRGRRADADETRTKRTASITRTCCR